ncbi:lipase family protein [Arthrobacter sp.]|uniref:lipase family protein n=1 Tax=Arthrobacter sp. TaxID=1667 RepID=UPI003A94ED6D
MTPAHPAAARKRLRLALACLAASTLLLSGTGMAVAAPAGTSGAEQSSIETSDAASGGDVRRQDALEQLAQTVDTDFYTPPATLPTANGSPVRSESADFFLDPIKLIRPAATATRIMYKSTDANDQPMAVTGTVLVPRKEWSGTGPRPVIGYAVGTQGVADKCAPSRQMGVGQEYEGPMISALLDAGYALAITDYEGLGTPGKHTYMGRASQGHAVIDSVRALQRLGLPGIGARNPVAFVGYSQGGGASAAAAELAPRYAPGLNLKGAYAGAVPADLVSVARNLDRSLYTAFLMYAVSGLGATADLDPTGYLNAAGIEELEGAEGDCTIEALGKHAFLDTRNLTRSGESLETVMAAGAFKAAIADQEIGNGRKPEVPVLLSHSLLDDVIPYKTGRDLAKRWCAQGANVSWNTTAGPTHIGGYVAAMPAAMIFLKQRFEGKRQLSSCWRI